jgi:hypothetical protein|tara:strand:- start:88 stop:576 length:489 start_codon:yes stop_codon:yes gene_type:complete
MKQNLGFRAWYYFRMGWSTYFAFVFAAINTLTVTYFLAIESYPVLKEIFPSFIHYVIILAAVGIPILTSIGYVHFKKSPSYRAESTVSYESNPWALRDVVNSEYTLLVTLRVLEMLNKLSEKNNDSSEELKESVDLENELREFLKNRTVDNKFDLNYFKNMS